jgi:hypothetical protein
VVAAVEVVSRLENIVCPDRTSMCPTSDTCCPIGGGKDGCCPKTYGVCCPDHDHCCPEHHTCGSNGMCYKGGISQQPMLKLIVKRDPPIVCPDLKGQCSAGSSCCLQADTKLYGCCPKENAVCCDGGKTCCPTGYTCSDKQHTCVKSAAAEVPFLAILN